MKDALCAKTNEKNQISYFCDSRIANWDRAMVGYGPIIGTTLTLASCSIFIILSSFETCRLFNVFETCIRTGAVSTQSFRGSGMSEQ